METLFKKISYTFNPPSDPSHEIGGVVRGLAPVLDDLVLIGEGMGLGGVVGVLGKRAIFPLKAETRQGYNNSVSRKIFLNAVSVKYLSTACVDKPYKKLRALLSPLYLNNTVSRSFYYMLMAGRTLAGVKSRYIQLKTYGFVDVNYKINGLEVEVSVKRNTPKNMRVLVANELSGRLFTYMRVNGVKKHLTPWMKLDKGVVELVAPSLKLSMFIDVSDDVPSFAGREVLGRRLDWAGISLELPSEKDILNYRVVFKRFV